MEEMFLKTDRRKQFIERIWKKMGKTRYSSS